MLFFHEAAWIQLHGHWCILSSIFCHYTPVGTGSSRCGRRQQGSWKVSLPILNVVHPLLSSSLPEGRDEEESKEKGKWSQWKSKVSEYSGKSGMPLEFQLTTQRNLRWFCASERLHDKEGKIWDVTIYLPLFSSVLFQLLVIIVLKSLF